MRRPAPCSLVLDAFSQQPDNDAFLRLMPAFRCAPQQRVCGVPGYAALLRCRARILVRALLVLAPLLPKAASISLTTLGTCCCSPEAQGQLLGFHFFRCREDATAQRPATPAPVGLYVAAAKMVREGRTSLPAVMAHLAPADEELKTGGQGDAAVQVGTLGGVEGSVAGGGMGGAPCLWRTSRCPASQDLAASQQLAAPLPAWCPCRSVRRGGQAHGGGHLPHRHHLPCLCRRHRRAAGAARPGPAGRPWSGAGGRWRRRRPAGPAQDRYERIGVGAGCGAVRGAADRDSGKQPEATTAGGLPAGTPGDVTATALRVQQASALPPAASWPPSGLGSPYLASRPSCGRTCLAF